MRARFWSLMGLRPPKLVVVLADLLEPLVGDAAAGGDRAQERHDVVGRLRAAEGQQEDGVVGRASVGSVGLVIAESFRATPVAQRLRRVEVEHDRHHPDAEHQGGGPPDDERGDEAPTWCGHDDDDRAEQGGQRRTARAAAPRAPGRRGRRARCRRRPR